MDKLKYKFGFGAHRILKEEYGKSLEDMSMESVLDWVVVAHCGYKSVAESEGVESPTIQDVEQWMESEDTFLEVFKGFNTYNQMLIELADKAKNSVATA